MFSHIDCWEIIIPVKEVSYAGNFVNSDFVAYRCQYAFSLKENYFISGVVAAIPDPTLRSRYCRRGGLSSGLIDRSQKMTVAARAMAGKKALGAPIVACRDPAPVLEADEQDLNAIA